MFGRFRIRTDLALEARESFEEDDVKIRGVRIEEEDDEELEIHTTRVVIETENGAKRWGNQSGHILPWKPRICRHRMRIITGKYRRNWQNI